MDGSTEKPTRTNLAAKAGRAIRVALVLAGAGWCYWATIPWSRDVADTVWVSLVYGADRRLAGLHVIDKHHLSDGRSSRSGCSSPAS